MAREPRSMSLSTSFADNGIDFTFKILVMGDSGVGKTCFINRFCEEFFRETSYRQTIGMDMKEKLINVDGKSIRLQVWDTAGQERFRTLTTAYYRGAMGIVILYDVTREISFDHVTTWLEDIANNASSDICKVLVGNKCDCKTHMVCSKRSTTLSEAFSIPIMEVSARTGDNVEAVFENLTRQMLASYDRKMSTTRCLSPLSSATGKIELLTKKKNTFNVCSC